jgi:hypothetical protein
MGMARWAQGYEIVSIRIAFVEIYVVNMMRRANFFSPASLAKIAVALFNDLPDFQKC